MLTSVRSFAGMHPKMSPQIRHLYKFSIAHITMIRSLARMQSHMRLQMVIPGETFMTLGTFERFLTRVCSFVILEDVFVAEGTITHAAGELLVCRIGRGGGGVFGEIGTAGAGWW